MKVKFDPCPNTKESSVRLMSLFCLFFVGAGWGQAAEPHRAPAANVDLKPVVLDELTWHADLASALEQAAKEKKHLFLDFTGVTCLNCKINEKKVFIKQEVKDLFKQFVCVQLYCDSIPKSYYKEAPDDAKREKDAEANVKFESSIFETEQLPLYVVIKPAGQGQFQIVAVYDEGRINQTEKFIEFLKKALP